MHIAYFNYLYDLYGVSVGSAIKAMELMTAMRGAGHEVDVYWRKEGEGKPGRNGSGLRAVLKSRLARYLHEPSQLLRGMSYWRQEKKILRRSMPDILIARLETYIFSPVCLARRYHLPFIVEADSPVAYELAHFDENYLKNAALVRYLENMWLNRSDRIFCVSRILKDYFVRRGIPDQKISVITNGADVRRFHPGIACEDILGKYHLKDKRVIGFVGSFHYWHGVNHLIEVMDAVLTQYPDAAFLLVGEGGPSRPVLEQYIRDHRHQSRIILTGGVDHDRVPAYINAMDVVLAPYPPLDFFYYSPVKVYEYMACGRAVVTSAIGQLETLIRHGETGMLVPPGDIRALIQAVHTLMDNPEHRKSMGEAAHRYIASCHTWTHKAAALDQLCGTVLAAHHARGER